MQLEPVSNGALPKAEVCVQDKHLERKKTNRNQPQTNKRPQTNLLGAKHRSAIPAHRLL